mgnify:CR=1 FL=1
MIKEQIEQYKRWCEVFDLTPSDFKNLTLFCKAKREVDERSTSGYIGAPALTK